MPGLPLCKRRRNKKKLNSVPFSVLSLPLQRMCLFGPVSVRKGFFSEGFLDRIKAGILFVLGIQKERERAG